MPKLPRHTNTSPFRATLFFAGIGLAALAFSLISSVTALAQTDAASPESEVEQAKIVSPVAEESSAAAETQWTFDNAQTSLIQNAFIAAPMSGVISTVMVTEGETIRGDSPLVRMRSELAEKELVVAKASLDAARLESDNDVNLRYAKRTLEVRDSEMSQSLVANQIYAGAVSVMELEELRLKVDQAALAIEQAKHDLMIAAAKSVEKEATVSIAQTKLDRHTVRTTVAGMVTEIAVESGEWVEAGKPMIRIISLDPIRVECFIDGRKHGRALVGRDIKFIPRGAAADATLSGTITFVSPELHPVSGQVRLWATLHNPDGKVGSGTPGKLVVK